jgi:hypothetical protein
MRHALAPTEKDPLDKMVIRGDRVTAVESETKKTIPLPPILGGVALAGGIVLVIIGAKNKP